MTNPICGEKWRSPIVISAGNSVNRNYWLAISFGWCETFAMLFFAPETDCSVFHHIRGLHPAYSVPQGLATRPFKSNLLVCGIRLTPTVFRSMK